MFEVRGRRDDEGRCTPIVHDNCNDIFLNFNGTGWKKKMIKATRETYTLKPEGWARIHGTWIWDDAVEGGLDLNLTPKMYTVQIAGRSSEVKIDAMRLFKAGTTPPEPPGVAVHKSDKMRNIENFMSTGTVIESGEIFSYDGKRIRTFAKTSYASLINDLNPGMYVLKIKSDGKFFSQRMMISSYNN